MTQRALPSILIALVMVGSAFASPPDEADAIITHLEFNSYTCETSESVVTANHDEHMAMVLKQYNGGVLLQTYVGTAKKKRKDIIDTVNDLNAGATVARFYIDGDGDTMIEAWYGGSYDRKNFAAFLEAWHGDTSGQYTKMGPLVQ